MLVVHTYVMLRNNTARHKRSYDLIDTRLNLYIPCGVNRAAVGAAIKRRLIFLLISFLSVSRQSTSACLLKRFYYREETSKEISVTNQILS